MTQQADADTAPQALVGSQLVGFPISGRSQPGCFLIERVHTPHTPRTMVQQTHVVTATAASCIQFAAKHRKGRANMQMR